MAHFRSASDQNLVRALRHRAASDPAFRESLARVLTADAKYEDYVQRKKDENGTPLPREQWEAYVFGRDPGAPQKSEQRKLLIENLKRQKGRRTQRMWGRGMWAPPGEHRRQFKPKALFSEAEIEKLPRWALQSHSVPDRLFAQAEEGHDQMLDWLDRGEGIDKALGAEVVRRDEDPDGEIDYSTPGPVVVIGSTKKREAAEDKVRERYGGNWSEGAVDLVRASIAVDKYEDLRGVIDKLKKSGIELVSRPRNRFRTATAAGYRDVVLNARLPNGHVMELQLHLKPMLQAKEQNHALYSQIKGLDDKVRDKRREEIPEDVMERFHTLTSRQREVYERAWQESASKSEPSSIFDAPKSLLLPKIPRRKRKTPVSKRAEESGFYFDVDGLPVKWVQPKMPVIHGGDLVAPVDSLAWFAERAVPITEEEFDNLVEARERWRSSGKKKVAGSPLVPALRHRAFQDPDFRRALRRVLTGERQ
jgi:hypothetical protein